MLYRLRKLAYPFVLSSKHRMGIAQELRMGEAFSAMKKAPFRRWT